MEIINKDGILIYRGEQKRPERIRMGTARRIGNTPRQRPTIIKKEDLDGRVF